MTFIRITRVNKWESFIVIHGKRVLSEQGTTFLWEVSRQETRRYAKPRKFVAKGTKYESVHVILTSRPESWVSVRFARPDKLVQALMDLIIDNIEEKVRLLF